MSAAEPKPETYYYKDGVEEFVKQLNQGKTPLHPKPVSIKKETRVKTDDKEAEIHVEVVLHHYFAVIFSVNRVQVCFNTGLIHAL